MKVRELLTDKSKWVKGNEAVDRTGYRCPCWYEYAVKYCLLGAISLCYRSDPEYTFVITKVHQRIGPGSIPVWNDAPERTFEDVAKLVNELDI